MAIIPGVVASSISGHLITGNFSLISQTTLGSSTSSYTFSSIPNTYSSLQLRLNVNDDSTGATYNNFNLYFRVNGDSGNNYYSSNIYSFGSSVNSQGASQNVYGTIGNIGYANASTQFTGTVINFADYANTNKYKSIQSMNGIDFNSSGYGFVVAGYSTWASTSAINSITVVPQSNNLAAGSTLSLYGVL